MSQKIYGQKLLQVTEGLEQEAEVIRKPAICLSLAEATRLHFFFFCPFCTPASCSLPRLALSASLSSLQKATTAQLQRSFVFHSRDQQKQISDLKYLIPIPGRLMAQAQSGVTPPISYTQGPGS